MITRKDEKVIAGVMLGSVVLTLLAVQVINSGYVRELFDNSPRAKLEKHWVEQKCTKGHPTFDSCREVVRQTVNGMSDEEISTANMMGMF